MTRRRFVQIDGKLTEVPLNWRPEPKSGLQIIPDIKPYKSTITGETITSRSRHRSHLRQHNCIEVGNEKMQPNRMPDVPGRKEAIIQAMKKHGALRY